MFSILAMICTANAALLNSSHEPQLASYTRNTHTQIDPLRCYTVQAIIIYHILTFLKLGPQQAEFAFTPLLGLYVAVSNLFETKETLTLFYGESIAAIYLLVMMGLTAFLPLGRHAKLAVMLFCIYAQAYFRYLI